MQTLTRPKSLTELVTDTLRERIIAGELELGSQLSEARIAKQLEVSRTPVREAINRLEMDGLLIVEPQRGSFVFNLKPHDLAKLCDARTCLESGALKEAIRLNAETLHERLVTCVDAMTSARTVEDTSAYLSFDTDYHQYFFDCADNQFLNDAYQAIAPKMAAIRNRLGRHQDHMDKSFREHIEIADAVANVDITRALEVLRSHIGRKEGSYWNAATVGN